MLTMLDLETEEGKAKVEYLVQLELYKILLGAKGAEMSQALQSADADRKVVFTNILETINQGLQDSERYQACLMTDENFIDPPLIDLPFYLDISLMMLELQEENKEAIKANIIQKINNAAKVAIIEVQDAIDVVIVRANPSGASGFGFLQRLMPKLKPITDVENLECRIEWDDRGMHLVISNSERMGDILHAADRAVERRRFRNEVAPKIAVALMNYSSEDVQIKPFDVARRAAMQVFALINQANGNASSSNSEVLGDTLPLIRAEF